MAPLNDERNDMTGEPPYERFDNDRLLAYALDLEDDAELEQALATDTALRERLQSIRADLNAVEDQVRAAVPAREDSWADLSAARWDGLRPYVATQQAPAPRRRRFGLRVLAPAVGIAAAAALTIGIALSQTGGLGGSSASSGSEAAPQTTFGANSTGTKAAGSGANLAADAAAFQTAVVARAGAVTDGVQDFAVVRTLKGSAGHSVRLQVEVGGGLKEGSLALLLLSPIDKLMAPEPTPAPASVAPNPSASATEGRQLVHLYLYQGMTAAVQPLAAGTDPNSVTLP
jgi:hypothetical protein